METPKKQLSVPDTKIGQTMGTLGTYEKSPPPDRNHVTEQKGNGDLVQLGFNSKLGIK